MPLSLRWGNPMNEDFDVALGRMEKLAEAYKRGPLDGGHLSHRINLAEAWRSRLNLVANNGPLSLSRREVSIPRCDESADSEVELSYLRVMAFGYGDVGYGPYRAGVIAKNMGSTEGVGSFIRELWTRAHEDWKSGYEFLCERQVARLGASFATKLLYFSSPIDNRAPILDSIVSGWLWHHEVATKEAPIDSTAFDVEMYGRYISFVDKALELILPILSGIEVRDRGLVEYLIFQDRLFQRATWSFAPWVKFVD